MHFTSPPSCTRINVLPLHQPWTLTLANQISTQQSLGSRAVILTTSSQQKHKIAREMEHTHINEKQSVRLIGKFLQRFEPYDFCWQSATHEIYNTVRRTLDLHRLSNQITTDTKHQLYYYLEYTTCLWCDANQD